MQLYHRHSCFSNETKIVLLDLRFNQLDQMSFVMTSIHTPEFVMMKIESTIKDFMEIHRFDENIFWELDLLQWSSKQKEGTDFEDLIRFLWPTGKMFVLLT